MSGPTEWEIQTVMPSDMLTPDILDKMRKVLNLSQSSNEHEAALAMAKLKEMTDKYDVTIEQIVRHELGDDSINVEIVVTKLKNNQEWTWVVLNAISHYTDTKGLSQAPRRWMKDEQLTLKFYGFERDRKIAGYMAEYVLGTIDRLARTAWNQKGRYEVHHFEAFRWVNSWKYGFAMGLREQLRTLKQSEPPKETTGTSLVVVKSQTITKWVHENVETAQAGPSTSNVHSGAYFDGHASGKKHNINRAVEGDQSSLARKLTQ
jgi:hypothetical protein